MFSFVMSSQIIAHDDDEHEIELALKISDLRIKAPIPGQSISAGYMSIKNQTGEEVTIVRVSSRHASKIEMHTHSMHDGMMMMKKLESLSIPANGSVLFEEGGYHLMVFDPAQEAIAEGKMRVVFELSNDYVIPVDARIEHLMPQKDNSMPNDHHHH